jgi:TPR repeat protein
MSDPELIKMRCPKCQGGVEFPVEGIGQKIACPHCQMEITLKRPVSTRPLVIGGICLILLCVAAAFGAVAVWHRPTPAELKAMRVERLRSKAQAGYDEAQFELATRYFYGERGVQTNLAEAVNWYQKAAAQGVAAAQNGLGHCYANGYGVATNQVEAAKWFRKAAEQGLGEAEFRLGMCYEYGDGVAANAEEAFKWYRKAADQGDPKGQRNLGSCYEKGVGVASNALEAVNWYRKAADQGLITVLLSVESVPSVVQFLPAFQTAERWPTQKWEPLHARPAMHGHPSASGHFARIFSRKTR